MSDWSAIWPALISAASGLAGVGVGSYCAVWRDRNDRRSRFLKAQLEEFYAPLVGMRREIRAKSELRVRVHDAGNMAWVQRLKGKDPETIRQIEERDRPAFEAIIQYSNEQFTKELLPLYRRMLALFRRKAALAEESTRSHYGALVEFVEIWNRTSLPRDVLESLGHDETKLEPLYEDLECHLSALREKLRAGG